MEISKKAKVNGDGVGRADDRCLGWPDGDGLRSHGLGRHHLLEVQGHPGPHLPGDRPGRQPYGARQRPHWLRVRRRVQADLPQAQAAVALAVYVRAGITRPAPLVNGSTMGSTERNAVRSVLLTPEWVTTKHMNSTVMADKFVPAGQLCAAPYATRAACQAAGETCDHLELVPMSNRLGRLATAQAFALLQGRPQPRQEYLFLPAEYRGGTLEAGLPRRPQPLVEGKKAE
jgi:hypothetical protein